MVKEVQWQAKIVKRLNDEGNYAHKWSSAYTVGVPDLVTVVRGFGTPLIECKLEKDWHKNTVRTIAFKPKQLEESSNIKHAGGIAFGLIIVHNGPTNVKLCPVHLPNPRKKFSARLPRLLENSYDWRTKCGTLGGVTCIATRRFGQWLKWWHEATIADAATFDYNE